ncbi:MAG: glucosylceramidase [Candidatus Melainabacteria bacterium]|nr:glucosylceramidase [Candidatus Melainabacteria bacterium]
MIIPEISWKRKIGEPHESPGVVKVIGPEGGLPNFDDGYFQGIPLGGFGAGTFSQSFRGDFSRWHLEVGKHIYKTIFPCQFGFYENGTAFILNDYKPNDNSLSSWVWKKQNGTYHALYPRAYFEYEGLNLIQEQFSPIIPHNYQDTSYPLAIFRWHISNPTKSEREISLLWSWQSIFGSKENFFYQENNFYGLIFDNLSQKKDYKYGQMGIFVQREDVEVSYANAFSEHGDGSEIWKTFSKVGALSSSSNLKDSPGAICAKVKLKPYERKTIVFVLAWDFPILESGCGTKWYKHYTKFFGRDGKNVVKIARKAFNNHEKWISEIKNWQEEFLRTDKPDWFKILLINELYFLAAGGTIWTAGREQASTYRRIGVSAKSEQRESNLFFRQEEHFGSLECFDYPFYETLDVRFYGSFPLLKLWPELEILIMKDYLKTIDFEIKEQKFFDHPLDRTKAERKVKGAAPHDLGAPYEDPFLKINAYSHINVNLWKDLNSKFILLIYRDFYFTGKKDIEFLKSAWLPIIEAIKYLKQFDRDNDCLIENDNIPDQTYDNWTMHGASTYCNGLWLASLLAVVEIAKLLNKDHELFKSWFEIGRINLESKLWNGEYYLYDTKSSHKENIMADQLCGQWYADLLGLGDIFQKDRVEKVLRKIFEFNVKKIGNGNIGAINGINPDGTLLPESKIWKLNTQSNEIWSGVTLALASHMELRGLKKESLQTAFGIYNVVYNEKGYWFRTPEAWDINGNFRASLYQRPGSIWAFAFVNNCASI